MQVHTCTIYLFWRKKKEDVEDRERRVTSDILKCFVGIEKNQNICNDLDKLAFASFEALLGISPDILFFTTYSTNPKMIDHQVLQFGVSIYSWEHTRGP